MELSIESIAMNYVEISIIYELEVLIGAPALRVLAIILRYEEGSGWRASSPNAILSGERRFGRRLA